MSTTAKPTPPKPPVIDLAAIKPVTIPVVNMTNPPTLGGAISTATNQTPTATATPTAPTSSEQPSSSADVSHASAVPPDTPVTTPGISLLKKALNTIKKAVS